MINNIVLSSIEVRVIGALIEKELTTPEYYPLTINSLINACNQKSNRDPVVNYDEKQVEDTLNKLREKQFARRVTGSDIRTAKYRQTFTEELKLTPQEIAVMTVLMLRGPQTPGEIKGRTGRMFNFESLSQVDEVINNLSREERKFVVKLPRQAGMKESRYSHLLSGEPDLSQERVIAEIPVSERLEKAEKEIEQLKEEISNLKLQFEKFREQFE